jgi:hypothetical protein
MDSATLPANLLLNIRKEIVIEAPAPVVFDSIIEQAGPGMIGMDGKFMSYPVISHVQYRLAEKAGVTTLTLTHRAIGDIAPEHRENVGKGWDGILSQIKNRVKR